MSERNLPFWLMQAESFARFAMPQDNLFERIDYMQFDINDANHNLYCADKRNCGHFVKEYVLKSA